MHSVPLLASNPYGWLRSAKFDLSLILGTSGLALIMGTVVLVWPELEKRILLLNLWLLGYHHVISTYTRLVFDLDSFRKHKFLVLGLPWLILGGTFIVANGSGIWAITTTYLYWQWWHYTRQSYGIFRAYSRKIGSLSPLENKVATVALYLLPLWGILYRSYQNQPRFLGLELKFLPVSGILVLILGGVSIITLAWWLKIRVREYRAGRRFVGLTLYLISHFMIFFVGYLLIDDISKGWLVLNIWHNVQYIMFVWMANNNRFRWGVDPDHRVLSFLSQANILNVLFYFGVCLGLTAFIYISLSNLTRLAPLAILPFASLLVFQTINFHHYIVDAIIWKRRSLPSTFP